MARATFVKSARKPIYEIGKIVYYKGREGSKRSGLEQRKLDRTQPANSKDRILIHKGESYYWWQFKGADKQYSKTAPWRSQLTRSDFLSWLYDMEDLISDWSITVGTNGDYENPDDVRADWVSDIKSERDELQERLDNMPQHLQDSSESGMLLQERIDGLESWASDLEAVDCDIDTDELKKQAEAEVGEDVDESEIQERYIALLQERINEILAELKSIGSNL